MKKLLLLFIILGSSQINFAQDEYNPSCNEPDKKVLKLLEKTQAASSADAAKYFQEATEAAPESAMVYFEYAMYTYKEGQAAAKTNYQRAEKLFRRALTSLEKCDELCENYHADVYFYRGGIHFMLGEKDQAKTQFSKFLKFSSTDAKRYPQDMAVKRTEAEKIVGVVKEEAKTEENAVPFNPTIVINVSTTRDEFFPMISPDNELMFFTRRVDRKALGDMTSNVVEEFTVANRTDAQIDFDSGQPMPYPFNDGTFNNYGASTVSVDNKEMILCACKMEKVMDQQYNNCDLYSTIFRKDSVTGKYSWTKLENLGTNINTKSGWEGQPSLSADGQTLYFAAVRPSTQKDDIFISKRGADGKWGKAVPLSDINTPGRDKSPFMHQDSHTLYFVSDVSSTRDGVGGLDIYYCRMDDQGKWGKPINIGFPINSKADEIGLFVSTDGKLAYYSSFERGVWNIYSFELYEEARPQKVLLVKGQLDATDEKSLENVSIDINYGSSGKSETIKVNGNDGKYAAIIQADEPEDVMLTLNKEGAAFESKLIEKEVLETQTYSKNNDMQVKDINVGESYTINDILFATNSYVLSERSKFILKQFAAYLKANPSLKIAIHGHTDDVGNDENNLVLSVKRAEAVMKYLVSLGIQASRLESEGFGETKPKVPNESEANRAVNRRTEFVVKAA